MGRVSFTALYALVLIAAPVASAAPNAGEPSIQQALSRLYNGDYPGSARILISLRQKRPDDPLVPAFRAATYMFSEFTRLGILEGEFFADDRRIADKKRPQTDPAVRNSFYQEVQGAERLAQAEVQRNPNDADALFTLTISNGMRTDYASLIEKRQLAGLSYAKDAQSWAVRLLKVDPNYTDAYLTTGFSEYLLGSLPFFVRWFAHFDQTEGRKSLAIERLQKVASSGRYLGPYAKILLSIIFLREKQPERSRQLLAELNKTYPENPLIRTELAKVSALVTVQNAKK